MANNVQSSDAQISQRGTWSRKLEFTFSCLSFSVGLGSVWRFPYVCYRNGGGAFIIPFLIMLILTGIPIVFLELSLGQYSSSGIVSVWKFSPIFQGVGICMLLMNVFAGIYYNMVVAYSLFYLFASFSPVLPWAECGEWASTICGFTSTIPVNCSEGNNNTQEEHCSNTSMSSLNRVSSSDEYFHRKVLNISDGVKFVGNFRWELAGYLLLAWIIVVICLAKGIKTSGKAAYVNAIFPYIVMMIVFIRAITLQGSLDGIMYFLRPQWEMLLDIKVWGDAAVQISYSLSSCVGGLITLSSFNKFKSNCLKDAILLPILTCVVGMFAGFVIFGSIGFMARTLNTDVRDVVSKGAGLAFVAYPEIVTKLPWSPLWSILFFAMLTTLGLGVQITLIATVQTTIQDRFPLIFKREKTRFLLLLGVSVFCFTFGLLFCTQGGMYILQLFDNYAVTYSRLLVGVLECIAISWVYGTDKYLTDLEFMLGRRPSNIWKYCWKFVTPTVILTILIFTCIDSMPTQYGKYIFPAWADGVGSLLCIASVAMIPITAVFKVLVARKNSKCTFMQVVKQLSKAEDDWGPALPEHRTQRRRMEKQNRKSSVFTIPHNDVPVTLISFRNLHSIQKK